MIHYFLRFLLAACLLTYLACEVERDFVTGEAVTLRFSLDTLSFDTVFTARGSATQSFTVYNDGAEPVLIDRIAVVGMTGVDFTFNVDGFRGPEARDVVIWGQDSIFVFVEAEVDPTAPEEVSPFIAEDRIVFETGNVQESVLLQAFGQNAFYLNGFNAGGVFQPICQRGEFVLPTDLPTVIYGGMVIDSCTLRVLAGSRVYLHGGIQRNVPAIGGSGIFQAGFIFTQAGGRVELLGTAEDPVLVASDRLEERFADSRGGYRGFIFGAGSRGNRIEHARIYNAIEGVFADSLAEVSIENSIIAFTQAAAVSTYQADVRAANSIFHSNSGNSVQALKGGNLTLDHCTVANYTGRGVALGLSNAFECAEDLLCIAPLRARVRNSILAGGDDSELLVSDVSEGEEAELFQLSITNSIVRTDARFLNTAGGFLEDFYGDECRDCHNLAFGDPLFADRSENDYAPDSLSVARGVGVFLPDYPTDLEGNPRSTDRPDAGALEWQTN
jgi:hypothetical protein